MQTPDVKKEAHRLIESLPESATWDDLTYTIYVRQAIEAGLEDAKPVGHWTSVKSGRSLGCQGEGALDEHRC